MNNFLPKNSANIGVVKFLIQPFCFLIVMLSIHFTTFGQTAPIPLDTAARHSFCKIEGCASTLNQPICAPIGSYGPTSIFHCGKFDLYFEDILLGSGEGFDDPTLVNALTIGEIRRNTFCQVLTYLQNTFDFSQVSALDPIKIEIEQSYSVSNPAPLSFLSKLASSTLLFPAIANSTPGYYGGYVYDKINLNSTYNTYGNTGFDGKLRINLDGASISSGNPLQIHDDGQTSVGACKVDLYSILLHQMLHLMGWFTMIQEGPAPTFIPEHNNSLINNPNTFSKLDQNYNFHGDIFSNSLIPWVVTNSSSQPIINPLLLYPNNTANYPTPGFTLSAMRDNQNYLTNQDRFKDNQPVFSGGYDGLIWNIPNPDFLNHLDEDLYSPAIRYWISPGYAPYYVMAPFLPEGIEKRNITFPEYRTLLGIGYSLNSIFGNSNIPGSNSNWLNVLSNNHKPEHLKNCFTNGISIISTEIQAEWVEGTNLSNSVNVDFIKINDGTPLIINLNSNIPSGKLFDQDGDQIMVMENSLVGIRGVGIGGNNHDCLTISQDKKIISYLPRANFIGRAQFYFQLYDGKEPGAIALYTIDVVPPISGILNTPINEMVVNGDFEEGTEVKTVSEPNKIGNGMVANFYSGFFLYGSQLSDAHPFFNVDYNLPSRNMQIQNSLQNCGVGSLPYTFGLYNTSFSTSSTLYGDRFSRLLSNLSNIHTNYSTLSKPIEPSKHYNLEFDLAYFNQTPAAIPFNITCNFTNNFDLHSPIINYIQSFQINPNLGAWIHVSIPFFYCANNPSSYFELRPNFMGIFQQESTIIDNISLKETPFTLTATTNTTALNCNGNYQLNVNVLPIPCSLSYSWSPSTYLNSTTISNPIASNVLATTIYTVVVTDALMNSATATVTVNPVFTPTIISNPLNATICQGQSITLTASGGVNYVWSGPTTITNGVPFTPLSSGVYVVTATAANNCTATASVSVTVNPSPSVNLIASSPCIPTNLTATSSYSNYLWTDPLLAQTTGTSNVFNATITGLYAVQVTDGNGCTNSTTINMSTMGITASIVSATGSPCGPGDLLGFPAPGNYSYTWTDPLNNTVTYINNNAYGAPVVGTYTLVVTDANGCTSSATYTVLPIPTVSASSSGTSGICTTSPVNLIASSPTAVSFTWNPGNISGNNVVVNPAVTTLYIVTATDANGCTATSSVTIPVIGPEFCCDPAFVTLLNSTIPVGDLYFKSNNSTSSSIGLPSTSIVNKTIYIDGNFYFNQSNYFDHCDFYFTPNAKIIFNPISINCHFEYCNFRSVCDMWDGMEATSISNLLSFTNCTINDMIQGAQFENGAHASIENCTFENNRIGLKFVNTPNLNGDVILGNTFTSSSLKAPYLGQLGEHGILLFKTQMIRIGDPTGNSHNVFSNLNNGITHYIAVAPLTNTYGLYSYYNQFNDIVGGPEITNQNNPSSPSLYSIYTGCGIYLNKSTIGETLPIPKGNLISLHDEFTGVTKAIVSNKATCTITYATLNKVQCGFMHAQTDLQKYIIQNNSLGEVFYGMQFVGNSGNNSVVENNTIHLATDYLPYWQAIGIYNPNNINTPPNYIYEPAALWPVGIDIQHITNLYSSPFDIGGNPLNPDKPGYSNYIEIPGNGGTGIRMLNAGSGYKVEDNNVEYTSSDVSECGTAHNPSMIMGECNTITGISISNGYNTSFSRNHINSFNSPTSLAFLNRRSRGFSIDNSVNLILECNTTAFTHYGIESRGNCQTDPENIRGNLFNFHKLAWLFRSYNGVPGGFGNNVGNSPNTTYQDNNNWFNGTYYSYFGSPTKIMRLTYSTDNVTSRKIYINQNNTATNLVQSESKSNVVGGRYAIINDNYQLFNDCSPKYGVPEIGNGGLSEAEANEIMNGDNEYPLFNEVSQFLDKSYLYRLLALHEDLRNNNVDYLNFYGNQTSENLGKLERVDSLIALLAEPNTQADQVSYNDLLNTIVNANANIVNNGQAFENCQAWINDRYVEVMESDADLMTPAERINILLLANSCPAAVGNCVYTARSLCALLYPGMQYHDDLLCAASLPPSKHGQNPYQQENELLDQGSPENGLENISTILELYPNPNYGGGQLNLSYSLPNNKDGLLFIYDMIGQLIQQVDVSSATNKMSFLLNKNMANGMYKVVLVQGEKVIITKKLSIVQ